MGSLRCPVCDYYLGAHSPYCHEWRTSSEETKMSDRIEQLESRLEGLRECMEGFRQQGEEFKKQTRSFGERVDKRFKEIDGELVGIRRVVNKMDRDRVSTPPPTFRRDGAPEDFRAIWNHLNGVLTLDDLMQFRELLEERGIIEQF